MIKAMSLKVGKVKDDGYEEWIDFEWLDLFHYCQFNYSRLKLEGKLPKLIQRLNFLAGYEKVDPFKC